MTGDKKGPRCWENSQWPGKEALVRAVCIMLLSTGRCSRVKITVSYLEMLFVRALSLCLAHSRSSINHG